VLRSQQLFVNSICLQELARNSVFFGNIFQCLKRSSFSLLPILICFLIRSIIVMITLLSKLFVESVSIIYGPEKKASEARDSEARGDGILPCCAGVQFSSDSLHAFTYERKVTENRGLWRTQLLISRLITAPWELVSCLRTQQCPLARARARTARSGDERTNHENTAPPHTRFNVVG